MDDLTALTMQQASEAIRTRAISPVDLVEAYLARIDAVDGGITSYILVAAKQARAAAGVAARRRSPPATGAGRFTGSPMGSRTITSRGGSAPA